MRIYEYTPGFLHAKCWVSDDRAAVVGSINMDYRSLFLHFECGVLLQYNSQVAALRDDVRATLPQCREIHISDCRTSIPGTLLDSAVPFGMILRKCRSMRIARLPPLHRSRLSRFAG